MKKSKQLFENQNLMKLKKHKIEVNFFYLLGCYRSGNEKKGMYIERNNLQHHRHSTKIYFHCRFDLLEKTIDTILEAASTECGDGKYLFLTFKKPIESEPKKRNGYQITNLNN
jgi:hypothetical protein